VEDVVHLAAVEGLADVDLAELEARLGFQVLEVVEPAGEQIVDGDDGVAVSEQGVAQVRPEESSPASDKSAF